MRIYCRYGCCGEGREIALILESCCNNQHADSLKKRGILNAGLFVIRQTYKAPEHLSCALYAPKMASTFESISIC